MTAGVVKWFNHSQNFGFITLDGGGEGLFAHFSAITTSDYKSLHTGQLITFEVTPGFKGKEASYSVPN